MPYPYIDKDRNASKIDPKAKKYIVWFKPKNERQNKRDDKLEILKSALGLGDYENVFNVITDLRNDTKRQQAKKNLRTISDIDKYTMPFLMLRLTDSQYHRLRKNPNIKSITQDIEGRADVQTVPWGIERVHTSQAWQISSDIFNGVDRKGDGVLVGISDTGIDASHEDLNVFRGVSFADLDLDDFAAGDHGTHVAGTVAALDNDIGVVGVAPDCLLVDLKTFNSGGGILFSDGIEGFVYAIETRIQVVNTSWGATANIAPPEELHQAILDYVNTGGIHCASMGNEGVLVPDYPENSHYPGSFPEPISVSAIDENGVPASFTNFGPPTDIAAPGVGIFSTVLDNLYGFKNGTSMATPCVSGVCALALSNWKFNDCLPDYESGGGGPSANRGMVIRQILEGTTDKNVNPAFPPGVDKSPVYGFGVPNVDRMLERLLLTASGTATGGIGTSIEHGF